jgi:hypothetical protein
MNYILIYKKLISYLIFDLSLFFLQPFSNEIFREKLTIWVTVDDQPFTVTECSEFKELIKLCNGKLYFLVRTLFGMMY